MKILPRTFLLLALFLCTTPVHAADTPSPLRLTACKTPDGKQDAMCGTLDVPEDRALPNGRKIPLRVLVLPAQSKTPAPDPLFAIAGGPGQSAVDAFSASPAPGYIELLRKDRALVLVDQRGTGKSNLLDCNFYGDRNKLQNWLDMPYTPEKIRECRDQLKSHADLAHYTTTEAAHDMDDVRRALGYERINVLGGSYGTTAALVYLREHGKNIRSVVLEGVAPMNARLPLSFPATVQRSVDQVFADCAVDPACNGAFPKVKEEFAEVLKKLEGGPATFRMRDPLTGKEQEATLTREMFVEFVRPMLYVPQVVSAFPLLIHRAAQGEFDAYANVAWQLMRGLDKQIARGMHFSVVCSEDVPFITEAEIVPTLQTYLRDDRIRRMQKACAEWPAAKVSPRFLDSVESSVPVLLISGEMDPATPPELAREAARKLSNSRVLAIKKGTHLSNSACVDKLIADFISKGSSRELETGCLDEVKMPQFMTPAARP